MEIFGMSYICSLMDQFASKGNFLYIDG